MEIDPEYAGPDEPRSYYHKFGCAIQSAWANIIAQPKPEELDYNLNDSDIDRIHAEKRKLLFAEISVTAPGSAQTNTNTVQGAKKKKQKRILRPSNGETETATHVSRSGRVTKRLVLGGKTPSTPVGKTNET